MSAFDCITGLEMGPTTSSDWKGILAFGEKSFPWKQYRNCSIATTEKRGILVSPPTTYMRYELSSSIETPFPSGR